MGSIKDNDYTPDEWESANFCRAFSHPARERIIRLLLKRETSNICLSTYLNLNRKTVREHLDKIQDANLIEITYMPHFYLICLNEETRESVEWYLKILPLLKKAKAARHIR